MRKMLITLSCIALLPTIISCGNASRKEEKVAVNSCLKEEQPSTCMQELANDNNSQAQVALGDMYFLGKNGLEKNYSQAIDLYDKSAMQGVIDGQVSLAQAYESNHTKEDNIKAYAWRLLLVNTQKQKYNFAQLEVHMTDEDISKAKVLEKELLKKIKAQK